MEGPTMKQRRALELVPAVKLARLHSPPGRPPGNAESTQNRVRPPQDSLFSGIPDLHSKKQLK